MPGMVLSPANTDLLATLPAAMGAVDLYLVDGDGRVEIAFGDGPPPTFSLRDGQLQVQCSPQRQAIVLPLPAGGHVVASCRRDGSGLAVMLERLLTSIVQREQLEQDMISMNSSSLQLLEQVSMMGETLPRLSTGESDAEVAAMGLKALLVAASVNRAVYCSYDPTTRNCEVLVHVVMDAAGQAIRCPYPLEPTVRGDAGFLREVLAKDGSVVVRSVHDLPPASADGGPERLARSQVIGVPVSYGAGDQRVLLGVLLAMDKRCSRYSNQDQLGSEEGQVAHSFAAMLGAVIGARKTAEMGKELSMAHAIQSQILPERPAVVAGFDLAADYRTCGDVGGDYFDFVPLADGRTMVVVADVSGHNLASGMMMVSARATLRTLAGMRTAPAELFRELAGGMFRDLTRTERFITAVAVTLKPHHPEVEVVNAGHNDLMVFRAATRTVEQVAGDGTILGFMPAAGYRSCALPLAPGDFVCLYTDGVTETIGPDDEMFGEQRLAAVLRAAAHGSARAIVDALLAAVQKFRGGGASGDDVTAVVVKATGTATGAK